MVESGGDGASAHALSDGYMRLRNQIGTILDGDLSDEFNAAFPEIQVPQLGPGSPSRTIALTPQARRSQALLAQLAGWLEGLIAERTLDQRLRYEAEERVKLERRKPPGFQA
jgi:hypothetical protein